MEHWRNDTVGIVEVLREKPVPVPLYTPHVLHGLTQDQTWACMVRGQ